MTIYEHSFHIFLRPLLFYSGVLIFLRPPSLSFLFEEEEK